MSRDDWRGLVDVDVFEGRAGAVTCHVKARASGRLIGSLAVERAWITGALNA